MPARFYLVASPELTLADKQREWRNAHVVSVSQYSGSTRSSLVVREDMYI